MATRLLQSLCSVAEHRGGTLSRVGRALRSALEVELKDSMMKETETKTDSAVDTTAAKAASASGEDRDMDLDIVDAIETEKEKVFADAVLAAQKEASALRLEALDQATTRSRARTILISLEKTLSGMGVTMSQKEMLDLLFRGRASPQPG